jgi:two-component system LytT family sensor kinase
MKTMMFDKPLHSKSLGDSPPKEVYVRTGRGNIECVSGNADSFRVEVYAQHMTLDHLFEWRAMNNEDFQKLGFRIFNSEGKLSIVSSRHSTDFFSSLLSFKRISFRLFLPKNCSVHLETQWGDIRINGLTGNHRYLTRLGSVFLDSVKGTVFSNAKNFGSKVEVTGCEGEFRIASGGGNQFIRHSSGEMDFHTDGGNIRIENFSGRLNGKTRGGNVLVDGFRGELKTASWGGNLKILKMSGSVTANTMGGNITLDTDAIENYAWLETNGGRIEFQFFEDQKLDIYAKGNRVRASGSFTFQGKETRQRWKGQVNGGGADVRLRTSGGNIKIIGKSVVFQKKEELDAIWESSGKKPIIQTLPQTETLSFQKNKLWEESKRGEIITGGKSKKRNNIPRVGQTILALVFIAFLTYGFNTFIYFGKRLIHPQAVGSESEIAVFYLNFYLNLINGGVAFLATSFFILFLESKIRLSWLRYLLLVMIIYVVYFFAHGILFSMARTAIDSREGFLYFYNLIVDNNNGTSTLSNPLESLLYTLVPVFAGCAFYAYWNRSRNLNQRISEQELQLLNLEKLKTKAQLNALEARINPHFLYNSLNSIAGLIHENPDKAEDMMIELSKLFRATTGRQNESYHSIEEEINLVKSYLAIEQMRFGERLTYEIHVQEELLQHKIPRFLLQPLVENAIKHGISQIADSGEVSIDIRLDEEKIKITIHDNGPAFGEAMSGGYGLKSVRDKLNLIYEGKASLDIENEPVKKLIILIDKNYAL